MHTNKLQREHFSSQNQQRGGGEENTEWELQGAHTPASALRGPIMSASDHDRNSLVACVWYKASAIEQMKGGKEMGKGGGR